MKAHIRSLQGLRAIAFIAIFLSHCEFENLIGLGPWGVSIFFILSGFVMTYNYIDREDFVQSSFKFMINKIKKLYPLHLIMMICAIIFQLRMIILYGRSILKLIIDVILHLTLTQIWIPNNMYYNTLNGVSWYLCVCVFLYLCFPTILKIIRRWKKVSTGFIAVVILFFIQVLIAVIAYKYGNIYGNIFTVQWITYYCPLSRSVDFMMGCSLGYIFLNYKNKEYDKKIYSLMEIIIMILICISWYIYWEENIIFDFQYIKYTILYTPTSIAIIWLLSKSKGAVSKVLANKIFMKLGNLTPQTFLIHHMVIIYITGIFKLVFNGKYLVYFTSLFAFIITVILSIIWKNIDILNKNYKI